DTAACVAATIAGQKLERAGKLVAAHEPFLACARPECPRDVIARCEAWARAAEDAVPSVVLVARDGDGHDVSGVRVKLDDRAPEDLSPRAIDLDPGDHRVTFERAGAAPVVVRVTLHEGEKNRIVDAVFPAPARP